MRGTKAPIKLYGRMKNDFRKMNFNLQNPGDLGRADEDYRKWLQAEGPSPMEKLRTFFKATEQPEAVSQPDAPENGAQAMAGQMAQGDNPAALLEQTKQILQDYLVCYEKFVDLLSNMDENNYNPQLLCALSNELLGSPAANGVEILAVANPETGKMSIVDIGGDVPMTDEFGQPSHPDFNPVGLDNNDNPLAEQVNLHHAIGLQKAIEQYNQLTNYADVNKPEVKTLYTALAHVEKATMMLNNYKQEEIQNTVIHQNNDIEKNLKDVENYNKDLLNYVQLCQEAGVETGDYRGAWSLIDTYTKKNEELDEKIKEKEADYNNIHRSTGDTTLKKAAELVEENEITFARAEQQLNRYDEEIRKAEEAQKKAQTALNKATTEQTELLVNIGKAKTAYEERVKRSFAPFKELDAVNGTYAVVRAQELFIAKQQIEDIIETLTSKKPGVAPAECSTIHDADLLLKNFFSPQNLKPEMLEDSYAHQYLGHFQTYVNAYSILYPEIPESEKASKNIEDAEDLVFNLLTNYKYDAKDALLDLENGHTDVKIPHLRGLFLKELLSLKDALNTEIQNTYPDYAKREDVLAKNAKDSAETAEVINGLNAQLDKINETHKKHEEDVAFHAETAARLRFEKANFLQDVYQPAEKLAQDSKKAYFQLLDEKEPLKKEIAKLKDEKSENESKISRLKKVETGYDTLDKRQGELKSRMEAAKATVRSANLSNSSTDGVFEKLRYFGGEMNVHAKRHTNSPAFTTMADAIVKAMQALADVTPNNAASRDALAQSLTNLSQAARAYIDAKNDQRFVWGTKLRHHRLSLAHQIETWSGDIATTLRQRVSINEKTASERFVKEIPADVMVPRPVAEYVKAAAAYNKERPELLKGDGLNILVTEEKLAPTLNNAPIVDNEEIVLGAPDDPNKNSEINAPTIADIPG